MTAAVLYTFGSKKFLNQELKNQYPPTSGTGLHCRILTVYTAE